MADFEQSGGCLCGRARYILSAQAVASYVCHCRDCQTRTGSAFGISTVVPGDALRLTSGETESWRRESNGAAYSWSRCTTCGTNLFSTIEAAPELAAIWSGTLDDTSWIKPKAHLWTKYAQPWIRFDQADVLYDEQPQDFSEIFSL